jgi:transcriptional regulator with XRE-family HTH domain
LNSIRSDGGPPPLVTWENPEMRAALKRHDLAWVFRKLRGNGFSQRRIGALTRQAQSEVSAIMTGREVMAYDLLLRIADGLGIPRGYMGLGNYDLGERTPIEDALTVGITTCDEAEEIRAALSHAAETMMGTALPDAGQWWQPLAESRTPAPGRIGEDDVRCVEHLTRVLRAIDYQHGGGACRDAVIGQAHYAQSMLGSARTEAVRRRIRLAVADLHNLAGWTSFDVGLYSSARWHFARAIEHARATRDHSLAANVLYRLGRVHLHRRFPEQALRFFQLGQLAAQDADDPLTGAMLHANVAWTQAVMGNEAKARSALGRARDEFSRGEDALPAWVSFFGASDLAALAGMVHSLLAGAGHVEQAINHLTSSVAARGPATTRSTVFELTALSITRLNAGDTAAGLADGHRAVDLAERVRSVRTIDRLAPLRVAASTHRTDDLAVSLVHRVGNLQSA